MYYSLTTPTFKLIYILELKDIIKATIIKRLVAMQNYMLRFCG